jgi:hypothetical protein
MATKKGSKEQNSNSDRRSAKASKKRPKVFDQVKRRLVTKGV